MSATKFLAFDFGAESGRVILGTINNEKLCLEQIHRFQNRQVKILGHIYWDVLYLFDELKKGLEITVKKGHKNLSGIGVDTWGVDFGLIGKDNQLLGNPFCYRDSRTNRMMEKAFKLISKEKIYSYTGIQFMQINSIFQLLSMVDSKNPVVEIAETLLFMPDLFNFFLTGEKCSEYTIASTSQLLNVENRSWEPAIFEKLNLPFKIMPPIIEPGSIIGKLLSDIAKDVGTKPVDIIAPACHDTASAVAAVPVQSNNWAYLSSGTWSLLGIEVDRPIINKSSLNYNFTNEGGFGQKIRYLRNTMGLWLLQRCIYSWRKEGKSFSYDELIKLATTSPPFKFIIDPDDRMFLNPDNMPLAIVEFCKKTNQHIPKKVGEFTRCIFESLALKYRFIIDRINSVIEKPVEVLHIIGGGSKNELLNQFAANATGIPVIAGPVEATSAGNILIQAIAKRKIDNIEEGRKFVARSFPLKYYKPENIEEWNDVYHCVKDIFS
ncbi:rhamnulokinase [candidate division KSB1 bacterium]|nr:MAG: rhamnulokinase [candidate division KSB1 bacterium]